MTPAICPDRGGGPSVPLPSPSEAFVLHPHRAATLPGFSSGWVSTVWCHRPLPGRPFAAVAGHCSFFGRWMPTAESHDEKWHMEGNVDRWLSCLLASLPAVGPLLLVCKDGSRKAERQKGSLGPASFASFRTASPPVLRLDAVSNHPPPTADTGARSPVLRRQTDSTLPAGRGVARPLCDQTPSSEPNQSLSTNNLPPVKPQRRPPTFDAAPCDVSAVARRLQPDPTPPKLRSGRDAPQEPVVGTGGGVIGERVPAIERAIPRHLFGTSQHLLLLCASYPGPRPRPRPGPRPAPRDHSAPARDPRAACGCLTSTATGRAAILSLDYDPAAIPRPSHLSLWTLHPSPAPS